MKTIFVCVAAALVVGCGKPAEQPAAAPATATEPAPVAEAQFGTSGLSGKVVFKGSPPKPATLRMTADPFCESTHGGSVPGEDVLIGPEGGLQNVFVYVKQGVSGRYPAPKEPAVLDQVGCMYRPRVLGLQAGQTLLIRNSDDTLHNVHALALKNPSFNIGQPGRGMESRKMFAQREVMIRFKCDVHPWMSSYLGVLEHPFFAVTGPDGAFNIERLPAGEYEVEAWHEKYGAKQQKVTLAEGETGTLAFEFSSSP